MMQTNKASISPPSSLDQITFGKIIRSDPLIANYFNSCEIDKDQYQKFLYELILDGIRYRNISGTQKKITKQMIDYCQNNCQWNQIRSAEGDGFKDTIKTKATAMKDKSGNKHYNVAYVKHNRFMSPKMKKQYVTPKVTQIIPARSPPHVIYGKPKVQIDDSYGCPYHYEDCFQEQKPLPVTFKQIHLKDRRQNPRVVEKPNHDVEHYDEISSQATDPALRMSQSAAIYHNPEHQFVSPSHKTHIQKKQRAPGMMRTVKSPKVVRYIEESEADTQYIMVKCKKKPKFEQESRIKPLIDRDKKNKDLQKKLNSQQKKIRQMEDTLKNLKMDKIKSQKTMFSKGDIIPLSDSSQQFDAFDSNMMNMIKRKQNRKMNEDCSCDHTFREDSQGQFQ